MNNSMFAAWLFTTGLVFWVLADVAWLAHPDRSTFQHAVYTCIGSAMVVAAVLKAWWGKDSK